MDSPSFDRLTRAFANGLSRRGLLGGLLAAAAPGAAVAAAPPQLKGRYRRCKESEAAARGAHHHCNYRRAKFAGRNLEGADFRSANLRHANFMGANLRGADFSVHPDELRSAGSGVGADLTGANFEGADTTGANFDGAITVEGYATCAWGGIVCGGSCFNTSECAKESRGAECCGNQAYNPVGLSMAGVLVCPVQRCCEGVIGTGNDCCGAVAYDTSSKQCCSGAVVDRGLSCCGPFGYDPATHVCCLGMVQPGTACCLAQGYDPATRVCCSGVLCSQGLQCCPGALGERCGACG